MGGSSFVDDVKSLPDLLLEKKIGLIPGSAFTQDEADKGKNSFRIFCQGSRCTRVFTPGGCFENYSSNLDDL